MNSELIKACKGYSASKGGLNLTQFRYQLIEEFPKKKNKIESMNTRKELEYFCQNDRNIQARIKRYYNRPKTSNYSKSPRSPKSPKSPNNSKNSKTSKTSKNYFKSGSKLTSQEKKMCRCIAHVSAKNPNKCYRGSNPEWKKGPDSPNCRNPYSICRSRISGVKQIHCYDEYNFNNMPDNEVRAIKRLHGK